MWGRGARQADNQEQWAAWRLPFKMSSCYGNGMLLCSKSPEPYGFLLMLFDVENHNVSRHVALLS